MVRQEEILSYSSRIAKDLTLNLRFSVATAEAALPAPPPSTQGFTPEKVRNGQPYRQRHRVNPRLGKAFAR